MKTGYGWLVLAVLCGGCDSGSRDRKSLAVASEAPKPEASKADMPAELIATTRARERARVVKTLELDPSLAPAVKVAPKPVPDPNKPPPDDQKAQPGDPPVINLPAVPGDPASNVGTPLGTDTKDLGGGYYGAVFSAYFSVKEQLLIGQIKQLMDLYKVEHNDKFPQSEDEFMNEIIKKNDLKLPELEPGKKYHYDPATGTLYVATQK